MWGSGDKQEAGKYAKPRGVPGTRQRAHGDSANAVAVAVAVARVLGLEVFSAHPSGRTALRAHGAESRRLRVTAKQNAI